MPRLAQKSRPRPLHSKISARGRLPFGLLQSLLPAAVSIAAALLVCHAAADEDSAKYTTVAAEAPKGELLAWMLFDDGPETFEDTPYYWLGRTDLKITIDVPPSPSHTLELLAGSKDDQRGAVASINGTRLQIQNGGYQGFRWVPVAVSEAVEGDQYTIILRRDRPKPAFFAGIRLRGPADKGQDLPDPEKKAVFRVALESGGHHPLEAFPEMRSFWKTPAEPVQQHDDAAIETAFRAAEANGRQAHEQFYRCRRFVEGWLAEADPETGLIPRNLFRSRDSWNAQDAAADNYPFMVLTAAITDRPLFEGRMRDMLRTETRLTSRIDRLPDTWSFSKDDFVTDEPNLNRIIFGGSEYVKDGLLPLTEWLGPSPWSKRMLGIVDDIFKHAPVETPHGNIPATNVEVNGEMLQTLSRVYWMTGEEKYLDWAIRLGDYYLLGDHHPTRDFDQLRLRDHGCEIVSGLCELYAAVSFARPEKKQQYQEPIRAMCNRILEIGRNEHGMLYNTINPKTGEHSEGICDTWGYNYNGYYTVYLIDDVEQYRQAVLKVLGNLDEHYRNYPWEGRSSDGYADSIESGLNLFNREPVPSVADWLDSQIKIMWSNQQPSGIVEGWHGDGNSARTAIMYAFWKTQGTTAHPWRKDLRYGAQPQGDAICISLLAAEKDWKGRVQFDTPRHKTQMHMPRDYPRINQFPEWFTVEADKRYEVRNLLDDSTTTYTGQEMAEGIALETKAGRELRLIVREVRE
jgi:hypothetical protein